MNALERMKAAEKAFSESRISLSELIAEAEIYSAATLNEDSDEDDEEF